MQQQPIYHDFTFRVYDSRGFFFASFAFFIDAEAAAKDIGGYVL